MAYRPLILFTIICLVLLEPLIAWAQPYCPSFAVTEINSCRQRIIVDRPIGWALEPGGVFMMHVSQTRTEGADSLLGRIYWCTVDTIAQNHIMCRSELPNISCIDYSIQVIVPAAADNVTSSDTIRPRAWNGQFGGIVAIWHPGTLVLQAPISAHGSGFRGGFGMFPTSDTTGNGYSASASAKGEGEVYSSNRMHRGGWPGSAHNAGGGGGAANTPGGTGGGVSNAYNSAAPMAPGGMPLPAQSAACVFGGGGGAGHRNDAGRVQGGNGGGLIAVYCDTLYLDSTATLDVSGESGTLSELDGAGGGGAGGFVSIHGKVISNAAWIKAHGGNGGSALGSLYKYGPGGGGAGGSIMVSQPLLGSSNIITSGGSAGLYSNIIDPGGSTRNASAGESGGFMIAPSQCVLPESSSPAVLLTCQDTIVDVDSTTILSVRGARACVWRDSDVTIRSPFGTIVQTPPIREPRWFVVTITTLKGCTVFDSVLVRPTLEANTLSVEADMLRAAPGDTIDVFVRFTSSNQLTSPLAGVAYISTRASIAQPLDKYAFDSTRVQARIPFTLASGATSTFRRTKYAITLGDSLSCIVLIDSVVLSSSPTTVRRRHGRITIDDICTEGNRNRLFDSSQRTFRIRGRHIIARADELWVVDLIGRQIAVKPTLVGQELHLDLPDDVHGIMHIVTIANGQPLYRTVWINE